MLATYKNPEIPDQDKSNSGNLLYGIQTGKYTTPLVFYTSGNNSAIVRFEAVKFDQFKKEVDRITLSNALIDVDVTNNIYHVDGLTNYNTLLENGVYRFEFENDTNNWTTEYFRVNDYSPSFTLSINTALGVGNSFQLPLPSSGVYNFTVNWGDGSQNTITAYNQVETLHAYSGAFTGEITISGQCEGWSFNDGGDKLKITSANIYNGSGLKYVSGAFYGCTNLTTLDVSNWDASSVTDFSNFAHGCSSLLTLDTSNWNTSNVINFSSFIQGCGVLTSVHTSNWDTSSVTDFSHFATICLSLSVLDVSTWDTSSVADFSNFIDICTSLLTLDTSNWNTSSVTDFNHFAASCSDLITLDVSNWNTSSVTDFSFFVQVCRDLVILDVSNWDTSNVTTFSSFANVCTSLIILDPNDWNLSNAVDFSYFASGCTSLTTLITEDWVAKFVTNFRDFANGCTSLTSLATSNWDTNNVTNFANFVRDCTSLTTFFEPTKFWTRAVPVPTFSNCFTAALLISNYAAIPNNWKGL